MRKNELQGLEPGLEVKCEFLKIRSDLEDLKMAARRSDEGIILLHYYL